MFLYSLSKVSLFRHFVELLNVTYGLPFPSVPAKFYHNVVPTELETNKICYIFCSTAHCFKPRSYTVQIQVFCKIFFKFTWVHLLDPALCRLVRFGTVNTPF